MAITIPTASRNAACDAVVDLSDAGTGAAHLKIYTTGLATLLADLTMSDPAFGAAATGVATASAISDDTSADNTGTAAEFKIEDSDANEILRGSVGTSGQDINLNTVSITAGDTVSITSLTVTMPAS